MEGSWRYKRTGTRERPSYLESSLEGDRSSLRKPGRGEKEPFPQTVVISMTGKCKGSCGREPGWEVLGERVLQLGFRGLDGAGARSWPGRAAQALGLRGKGKWGKQSLWCAGRHSRSKVGPFTWAPAVFTRGWGPDWQGDLNRHTALPSNLCPRPNPRGNGGCYHPGFPPKLETARDEPGN